MMRSFAQHIQQSCTSARALHATYTNKYSKNSIWGSETENVNEELIEESTATKSRKKAASDGKDKRRARRWTEPEIDQLIDLLEEKDCLWDVNKKDPLRNKRERALEEMRNILDIDVAEIKAKITSLRAQLGRCLLYTSPSPRDLSTSRMPSSA